MASKGGGKDDPAKDIAKLKYGEARQRLEEILDELERQEVDIDDLADRVKEAAVLLRVLNDKLTRTETEVRRVVSELRGADAQAET